MDGYIALDTAAQSDKIQKVVLVDGGGVANEDTSNLVIPYLGRLEKSFDSSDDYLDLMKQSLRCTWCGMVSCDESGHRS